ncbi:MAG TPA: hypothetical protein VK656_05135 [Candidatus Acidoferrum sp.]|jgi:hypothetical protein|nr:hypothetical protein [Candidatus Acidoferrum sp.]
MADLGQTGFEQFDRIVAIVRRTRELLDAVASDGALPDGGADYLSDETLPHLESVQRGFRGWLRADSAGRAELHYLITQSGAVRAAAPSLDLLSPAERAAAQAEAETEARAAGNSTQVADRLREPEAWHLAALAHARLVLALLPRLPDGSVRYPAGRRTYADIAAPRGPAELAQRIDELERELWRTATGHARPTSDGSFRRTYGFFDASAHLADGLPG